MRSDDKPKDDVSAPSGYGNRDVATPLAAPLPGTPPAEPVEPLPPDRDPPDAKLVAPAINDVLGHLGGLIAAIVSVTPVLHNQQARVGMLIEAMERLVYNSPAPPPPKG